MQEQAITFSFAENWRSYVDTVNEDSVKRASGAIEEWLTRDQISGKTVLDIGCGSRHPLALFSTAGREAHCVGRR